MAGTASIGAPGAVAPGPLEVKMEQPAEPGSVGSVPASEAVSGRKRCRNDTEPEQARAVATPLSASSSANSSKGPSSSRPRLGLPLKFTAGDRNKDWMQKYGFAKPKPWLTDMMPEEGVVAQAFMAQQLVGGPSTVPEVLQKSFGAEWGLQSLINEPKELPPVPQPAPTNSFAFTRMDSVLEIAWNLYGMRTGLADWLPATGPDALQAYTAFINLGPKAPHMRKVFDIAEKIHSLEIAAQKRKVQVKEEKIALQRLEPVPAMPHPSEVQIVEPVLPALESRPQPDCENLSSGWEDAVGMLFLEDAVVGSASQCPEK